MKQKLRAPLDGDSGKAVTRTRVNEGKSESPHSLGNVSDILRTFAPPERCGKMRSVGASIEDDALARFCSMSSSACDMLRYRRDGTYRMRLNASDHGLRHVLSPVSGTRPCTALLKPHELSAISARALFCLPRPKHSQPSIWFIIAWTWSF